METCWNVSPETNDLTVNGNGCLATVSNLESKIVRLRERFRTLKSEAEDGISGIDMSIMQGNSPAFAKAGEIERVAKTLDIVDACKVLGYRYDSEKRTVSYSVRVVFVNEDAIEMDVNME